MLFLMIIALCALPLFILGLFLKKGKGLMLLAGYNTMSDEQRAQVNKEELSKKSGNLMLRMGLEFLLFGVAGYFKLTWLAIFFLFVSIADPCIFAVMMSKKIPKTSSKPSSKAAAIAIVIFTVLVLAAVGGMFFGGEKEPSIVIADGKMKIESMYGLTFELSEVSSVSLREQSMSSIGTGRRTNGYAGFGDTLKGHFSSEGLGDFLLFVKADSSPTLLIERADKEDIYISFRDGEKTRSLYLELSGALALK